MHYGGLFHTTQCRQLQGCVQHRVALRASRQHALSPRPAPCQQPSSSVAAGVGTSTGTNTAPAGSRLSRASRRSQLAAADPADHTQQQAAATQHAGKAAPGAVVRGGRKTTAAAQSKPQQQPPAAVLPTAPPASRAKKGGKQPAAAADADTARTPSSGRSPSSTVVQGPHVATPQPLPHVLILHTGGTLGMDAAASFEVDPHDVPHQPPVLKRGTGGIYGGALIEAV